jgi:hypothetical protein
LQALHPVTQNVEDVTWIKGTHLRKQVRSILGHTPDQMGYAQWIGHILKRLQLVDNSRRRHHVGGKLYAIDRCQVLDMMQRYDVPPIENGAAKKPVNAIRLVNQSGILIGLTGLTGLIGFRAVQPFSLLHRCQQTHSLRCKR